MRLVLSLRHCVVVAVLGVSTGAFVATSMPTVAHARRGKAKRKSKGNEREIKKEDELAPKKEYTLDDEITQTKDLRPVEVGGDRPTLSPEELKRATTEQLMEEKLDEEIELAKRLLELETECDSASPVRFRLADLYWEKAKRAFFKSQDFSTPEADRKRFEDFAKKLQDATIKHYTKIVDDCEGYKDYAKVLFYLGKALSEVDKPKDGAGYFKRVIKEFPDSEWLANAWFMVGEYYFNFANDANNALKAYKKAAEVPRSNVYAFAIYKQGWCHINTGDWDQALARFKDVVVASDDPAQELDPKGRLALRKEALRDYVRAYSNVGNVNAALKTFYQLGGKEMVPSMMEWLGNWYVSQGAHPKTIEVYGDLIKSYKRSTRIPVFQGRIVDASSRLGDKKSTVAQVKLLTDYFGDLRTRVQKGDLSASEKETIDKDVKEAEDIAENTLRRLALEYHKEAKKLRGSAAERTFAFALDLYKHYLEVFPEPKPNADVNYVFFMRFYYAEVLYKLEDFLQAARNYDMVVAMNPDPKKDNEKKIVLAAAEESVRSYDELVQDLDRKNPPEISGTEPKPIPKVKQDLISACQRYIEYVGTVGDKIVEIRYKMARIYYTYNHFSEAAPAFNDIVKNHAEHEVACYAANLVLDIYNGKKDYKSLKEATRAYLDNKKLACGDEDRQKFAKIEESSSFLLVKTEYEDKKRYVPAANAYLQFYKDYPKSEFADDAVYNAAVNYDLGNKLDKANEMRRFLVEKLPDSPLVPDTLYNIALSYERIVDFENAAVYFDRFATRYPNDKRTKDAVYNAGLYRATLRDYAAGKSGRELFIKKYPGDPEVHKVAFSICEMQEQEAEDLERQQRAGKKELAQATFKKWVDAHDCYERYVREPLYARHDPDLVCHAQFRIGEIRRTKADNERGYQEQKKALFAAWPRYKREGIEKVPRCAAAVAEIQFRELEPPMRRYKDMLLAELNPTDAGTRKFKASVTAKIKERDRLISDYRQVVEIGVAEWALAALFQIGEAYRDSIQKFVEAPVPDKVMGEKLTAEQKQLLRDQLKQEAAPIEESAVEAYRLCVQKANELGVYNRWSVRALDQLNKLRPEEYPLVVERIAELQLANDLTVATNGLVVPDGNSWKTLEVTLGTAAAPSKAPAPAPAAAPAGGAK